MKHLKTLFAVAIVVGLAGMAGADVIADYNFGVDNGDGSYTTTLASADSDVNTTASDLVLGDGLDGTVARFSTTTDGKGREGGNPLPAYRFTSDNFNLDGSFASDDYIEFQITADAGDLAPWDQLSIDRQRSNSTEYPIDLQTSTDGVTFGSFGLLGDISTDDAFETGTIDLSGLGALATGETMYFRLFIRGDAVQFPDARSLLVDNIQVSVVPEPATMALLGIGGLGVLIRRKK